MTPEQIEAEILSLPIESQATLVTRLLSHLGQSRDIDPDVSERWIEEAQQRDRAMDAGEPSIPANKIFQRIRASLQSSSNRRSSLGMDRGKLILSEDFNDPLPEDTWNF